MEYSEKGVHRPPLDYKRDRSLMRLVNFRLYEITGNNMYLWLGSLYKVLEDATVINQEDKLKFNLIDEGD